MSLPPNKKNYFLVNAQDLDIPDAQRSKHMPKHMEQNIPLLHSKKLAIGMAVLQSSVSSSSADAMDKVVGSSFALQVDTAEEAWEILKNDVFYTSGEVWDREKITVVPVVIAAPSLDW